MCMLRLVVSLFFGMRQTCTYAHRSFMRSGSLLSQHSAFFAASKDGEDDYRSQPKHAKPKVSVVVQRLCQKRYRDESFREALDPVAGSALLRQQIEFAGSNVTRQSTVSPSIFDRIHWILMMARQIPCQSLAQP